MKILVTGASGFIGKKLCEHLLKDGHEVVASIRNTNQQELLSNKIKFIHIPTINSMTDWSLALAGIDIVIHLAARVHVMNEMASDPLKEYLITNTDGTERLAIQAQEFGVKKFVFLSTIGVNGDSSPVESFTEFDNPSPHNPYSISKKIAEERLMEIANDKKMTIVILRAPLVYGKSNRGNFKALIDAVKIGLPLPLGGINNQKSFLCVGNLVDALKLCVENHRARGIYLVCDNEIISTPELIRKVASKLNRPARIFYLPYFLVKLAAKVTGNKASLDRLVNSLTVDSSKIRYELNWHPPLTMEEGLNEIIDDSEN